MLSLVLQCNICLRLVYHTNRQIHTEPPALALARLPLVFEHAPDLRRGRAQGRPDGIHKPQAVSPTPLLASRTRAVEGSHVVVGSGGLHATSEPQQSIQRCVGEQGCTKEQGGEVRRMQAEAAETTTNRACRQRQSERE